MERLIERQIPDQNIINVDQSIHKESMFSQAKSGLTRLAMASGVVGADSFATSVYAQAMPDILKAPNPIVAQSIDEDWLKVAALAFVIFLSAIIASRNKTVRVIPGDEVVRGYMERNAPVRTVIREGDQEEIIRVVRMGRDVRLIPPPGLTIRIQSDDNITVEEAPTRARVVEVETQGPIQGPPIPH